MYTQNINYGMREEYFGLSTDTKPTDADNGDLLTEIDTGKKFRFDKQNGVWYEQSAESGSSSGGSDSGSSEDFVVTVITTGEYSEEAEQWLESYTFDKTPEETLEAYMSGKTVKIKYCDAGVDENDNPVITTRGYYTVIGHVSTDSMETYYGFVASTAVYNYRDCLWVDRKVILYYSPDNLTEFTQCIWD